MERSVPNTGTDLSNICPDDAMKLKYSQRVSGGSCSVFEPEWGHHEHELIPVQPLADPREFLTITGVYKP